MRLIFTILFLTLLVSCSANYKGLHVDYKKFTQDIDFCLKKVCEKSDIVITTAQLFGRPAPQLIDNKTIDKMIPGSVIFDMAVESGGNVEGSQVDEIIERNGVKIIGISNLASRVSSHASLALSNNYNNWIIDFFDKDSLSINFDFEDEIIQSSVLVYDGKIMNERFK